MDIRTQAALLAAIVTLALAVAALLRDNRSRVFTLFALFSADLFLFSLAIFFLRWSGAFGETWWERLAVFSGALVPASALAFFLEFLGVARRPARRARNGMLAGSLSGLVVAVTPLVHVKLGEDGGRGVRASAGWSVVLSVLWGKMRGAQTRVERARLKYLFVGALVAVALSDPRHAAALRAPEPARRGSARSRSPSSCSSCRRRCSATGCSTCTSSSGKIVVVTALGPGARRDLRRPRVVGRRPAGALLLQHGGGLVRDPLALRAAPGAGRGVGGRHALHGAVRAGPPARPPCASGTGT